MTCKSAVERTLNVGESRRFRWVFPFAVATAMFAWGTFRLYVALTTNMPFEHKVATLLACVALLPTSAILFFTGAYLWVHRET